MPLSLIPGPSRTESRWPPTTRTRRAPGRLSATTFFCVVRLLRARIVSSITMRPCWNDLAVAASTAATGIGAARGSPSVALSGPGSAL